MASESDGLTHRVLLIDDNESIHKDYRKILAAGDTQVSAAEAALFGAQPAAMTRPMFDLDSAMQGREGVDQGPRGAGRGPAVLGRLRRHAHATRLGRPGDHRASVGHRS